MKIFENLDINNLENETWKDILDYEGDYQVSNIGRVKSFKKWHGTNERILKQNKDSNGYFQVNLCKDKISKHKQVHRLVHEAHIGKLEDGYDAHHINEDKEDNYVENLKQIPKFEHSSFHKKGENHPLFRKHHSEETRKKISERHKGKHLSEEHKKKISKSKKEENNPLFGKHHSEETLKKMSDSRRGKNNPNFKMTNQKIIDIQIDLEKENLSQKHIAKKHSISQSTVSLIKREKIRIT